VKPFTGKRVEPRSRTWGLDSAEELAKVGIVRSQGVRCLPIFAGSEVYFHTLPEMML